MIKNFNQYNLDKEIDFLFSSTNESITDFKNRLRSIVIRLINKIDINKFISKFFKYLKDKSTEFKKMAMGTFIVTLMLNSNYNIHDIQDIIDGNSIASEIVMNDNDMKNALGEGHVNLIFSEYEKRANVYLSRDNWKDSPLNGEMFAKGARKAYKKHGVLIPVELALAQAQFESHFGTTGLSAENNPFNVGEYDNGTVMTFNSPQEGINAYFNLMATDYLNNKSVDELLADFVNHNGDRYASNPSYEKKVGSQMEFNKKWIDGNI